MSKTRETILTTALKHNEMGWDGHTEMMLVG